MKSSLRAAGVTISLSNIYFGHDKKKVISIKKASEIFEKQKEQNETIQTDNEFSLQIKIDQLKNEIRKLEEEKTKLLRNLRESIEEEKRKWQEQKELEKKEAQKVGYKVGYDQGVEDALKQYESLLKEANEITKLAKQTYDETISKYDQAILELAVTIGKKILTIELEERPELFKQIVVKAIEDLKDSSNVEIYVHPSQYKCILNQKEELEQMVRSEDVISIYADQHLDEYDCLIRHPYGQIDVSIDTQLEQIKHALEEKLAER